jgi:hypothetical protein
MTLLGQPQDNAQQGQQCDSGRNAKQVRERQAVDQESASGSIASDGDSRLLAIPLFNDWD